jgi:Cu/Ag efflux pump CusA
MIEAIIKAALNLRLIVVVLSIGLIAFGLDATNKLSVDAFPDVTNVQVQIATEAPGRSPEEVERFITVPLEIAMTGLPNLVEMRSLNKPGLSLITLVFTDSTNVYFARQLIMERLMEVNDRMPKGITPVLGPVSTALGEILQYTLEKETDGTQELTKDDLIQRRLIQDWIVRPKLRSVMGVAEINSQGGYVKQYEVTVNPDKLRYFHISMTDVFNAVARNNANTGGGILPQFSEQYLIRSVGLITSLEDIRSIVVKAHDNLPIYIRDIAEVRFGEAVRVGTLVKNGVSESVGGVVLMIAGGNAKKIVGRIKEKIEEINNNGMLPDGLKIKAYYDRSELVDSALHTVVKVLLEGVFFVVIVLFLFLGDIRSSLIVIGTLILTPLLTFVVMNKYGISANLMSLGGLAIAIGLMVDGSVVVVENAFARLSHLQHQKDHGHTQDHHDATTQSHGDHAQENHLESIHAEYAHLKGTEQGEEIIETLESLHTPEPVIEEAKKNFNYLSPDELTYLSPKDQTKYQKKLKVFEMNEKLEEIFESVKEVAVPVIFGVGIIIIVFLPLMTLEGMEGKMFAPLAYTIAIALFISLILSLTLTPVLSAYLLKPGSEEDTFAIRWLKKPYVPLLNLAVKNSKTTFVVAVLAFFASLALIPFLGTAFIPEMKEGSIVPAIMRVPNISLEESTKMEQQALRLVMDVPGVKSAYSGVGRGESPADPQAQNESTPILSLYPRDQWPKGWTQDTIAEEIRKKLAVLPGVSIAMAQPISARVAEMVTGVRSDVAVKIFGDSLDQLLNTANQISKIAMDISGAQDLRIEKILGQQYLNIEIDRASIARHGINVADINEILEIAIAGASVTDVYEGERRFSATVRLPFKDRDSPESLGKILLSTPSGSSVPLSSVADIQIKEGPAQISRELGKRRIVVGVNVKDRDLGGFVAELQAAVAQKMQLPEGFYLEWGGQFQNMQRALGHLSLIVPITIGVIFFLLFLLFNSVKFATLIIMVLPFASIGGIVGLFVSGEYLSVPASVGFIALWGIAVLNGVVLVSYIRSLREKLPLAQAVIEGAKLRFRPVMMTATVAMLGLIPFIFSTGPGSEVQKPLAIVVIGGLITSTLLTLVMLPALYPWFDDQEDL